MPRYRRKEVVSLSLSATAIRHLNRLVSEGDALYRGRSRSNIVDQILFEHEQDCREKAREKAKGEANAET